MKRYERVDSDTLELVSESTAAGHEPIVLRAEDAEELSVVAELVEVLPGAG